MRSCEKVVSVCCNSAVIFGALLILPGMVALIFGPPPVFHEPPPTWMPRSVWWATSIPFCYPKQAVTVAIVDFAAVFFFELCFYERNKAATGRDTAGGAQQRGHV